MTTPLAVRQILFPTDFSDASGPAGATAADLARQFGARLHVLHVVPAVTDPTPAPAALRRVVDDVGRGRAGRDGGRLGPPGAPDRGLRPEERDRSRRAGAPRGAGRALSAEPAPTVAAAPRLRRALLSSPYRIWYISAELSGFVSVSERPDVARGSHSPSSARGASDAPGQGGTRR